MTGPSGRSPRRARRVAALVAAVVLVALAVWFVTLGVEVAPSTGGLLTAPVPRTTLHGGWLLAATAAATAAILAAVDAGAGTVRPRVWRRSR